MRAITKEAKNNNSKLIYTLLGIVLFIILAAYVMVWHEVKKTIINILGTDNARFELKYDKIKVGGFPFVMKCKINNLNVKVPYKSGDFTVNFNEVMIRNLIYTKNVKLKINKEILFKKNTEEDYSGKIVLSDHDISFTLNDSYKINNMDSFIKSLTHKNMNDIDVNTFNNLTLKLVYVNDNDYENRTLRLNVDEIKSISNNGKGKPLEANFEFIFSSIYELDGGNPTVIRNVVDTFNFNDVTNNYSINLDGEYKVTYYSRSAEMNFNASVINYNYLVSAVNKDADFIFGKDSMLKLVQILELAPANEKDTRNNKFYSLKGSSLSKKFFINDVDINELVQKLVFKNELN